VAASAAPGVQKKPDGLSAARGGTADDLKIIKGIGPKLEQLCHKLGFFHFDQVAAWTGEEVAWVDENLEGFRGRVTRDRWVPQAKAIVQMGPGEFLRRIEAGEEF
jgi:NADH-quinone oxidoreductase subunit E